MPVRDCEGQSRAPQQAVRDGLCEGRLLQPAGLAELRAPGKQPSPWELPLG